jgi:hypothetical protein
MSTKMKSTPILNWLTCMAEIHKYIHSTPNQIEVAELSSVTNPETFYYRSSAEEVGRSEKWGPYRLPAPTWVLPSGRSSRV